MKNYLQDKKLKSKKSYKCYAEYIYENDIVLKIYNVPFQIIIIESISKIYYNDFIEVTDISLYDECEILRGSLKNSNIILEGTDGVGKSTIATLLARRGLICMDREEKIISKHMVFDVGLEERIKKYRKYLNNNKEKKLIFLVIKDKEELTRRIKNRKEILDEFDILAYEYGLLYIETYEKMKNQGNLFLVECDGKSPEDILSEVLKIGGQL
jgi:Predicted nucleotide kinase (related to CMP and AMP kinases)